MQPLNHDMDDLMRRAADDYPVKPQGMDWEKVAQQLAATDPVTAANQYGGLKKLLLLLPFLFGSFMCDRFLQYEYGHLKNSESVQQTQEVSNPTNTENVTRKAESSNNVSTMQGNTVVAISHQRRMDALILKNSTHPMIQFLNKDKAVLKRDVALSKYAETKPSVSEASVEKQLKISTSVSVAGNIPLLKLMQQTKATTPKSSKKNNNAATNKAYITMLFGPDLSRVKGQQTEPAGYNVGVMGGYQLAKRWAIEAGVFWDHKNYFSTGEYFKTNKIPLPYGSKVMQVNGYCAMFEIPVNVRFAALQKDKSSLFVSTGLSSYLMHNENYNYVVERYGTNYSGKADYKHASKNWFSVANLSVGYEHKLGPKINIRIEPYFKIPLSGVGIGSLPLSSKGVLLGLTYPIH